MSEQSPEGILLVDKPVGATSFRLVAALRKLLQVKRIGHAGTLDPFATGVMVLLVGRPYTRLSDQFLLCDKVYRAQLRLGVATATYDHEGEVTSTSDKVPALHEIEEVLQRFQGEILQVPPMFSAKKIQGKKLYEYARAGKEIERAAVPVRVNITLESYHYPYVNISVTCSKGTYIRSLAHDIGQVLGCGAHLVALQRTQSGGFKLEECLSGAQLLNKEI